MESFLDRFRCGWSSATQGSGEQWDIMSGFQSRCGVTRAEPACVIDDMPTGKAPSGEAHNHPGLPRIVEDADDRPSDAEEGFDRPPPGTMAAADAGAGGGGGGSTTRSDASRGSDMPAPDREREKHRLQKLLKDFAKECVAGIAVNVVNARTGRMPPYFFQMDRRLAMFSLRPSDGSSVEDVMEDFSMRDVVSIFKGQEVCNRVPFLGLDAASCVGIDMGNAQRNLVLHFDDAYERDKFYTSLQVLKMSVDIQTCK